ncbi:MAG: permease-like cell division protein FtsX [Eubacterium sp.]
MGEEIAKRKENIEFNYMYTVEEAWEQYQKIFKGHEEAAAGFEIDNPLANSFEL